MRKSIRGSSFLWDRKMFIRYGCPVSRAKDSYPWSESHPSIHRRF